MWILFAIIGMILIIFTSISLIKSKAINKRFIISKAKVVGFESYSYLMPVHEYSTSYNINFNPILEVVDNNKKIRIAIPYLDNKASSLKKGEEIEVVYPKGKIEKLKINNDNICSYYYLTIIMGVLIILLSIAII